VYACVYVYVHMYNVKNKLALEGCQPCFRDMRRRRGGGGGVGHQERGEKTGERGKFWKKGGGGGEGGKER